jgi:hypothetical protein
MTPPGSGASIIFGRGVTDQTAAMGSLLLAVDDMTRPAPSSSRAGWR